MFVHAWRVVVEADTREATPSRRAGMTERDALKVRQAALLGEQWKRSMDPTVRTMGADLLQVLEFEDALPAGFNRPMVVEKTALVDTLRDMLAVIEEDDSAGGFIEYVWADEPGKFEVTARYRIGNAMGQGGIRILHDGPSA